MPEGKQAFAIASLREKIFVIGGSNRLAWSNKFLEYSICNDRWSEKEQLPVSPAGASAIILRQRYLYLIGGDILG
jgi:N-acetylneuraminic acid mutarotase